MCRFRDYDKDWSSWGDCELDRILKPNFSLTGPNDLKIKIT